MALKLAAKCSSWPRFVELFSGDLSEGGIYVPTGEMAELGEEVRLDLTLPNGTTLALSGKVASVVGADEAAEAGRPPGLGVTLDPVAGTTREFFLKLLETARQSLPRPEPPPAPPPIPGTRPSPPNRLETAALEEAIEQAVPRDAGVTPPADGERQAIPPSTPRGPRRGSGPIVGIDLGTTNTSVAAIIGKKVSVLARPGGEKAIPSVVSFDREGNVILGAAARERIATDPMRTIVSPKRVLGRRFHEREVQSFLGQAPFRCLEGPDGSIIVEIGGRQYAIPQIISYILKDIRELAESRLGEPVTQAVLSVPLSFDEERVEALVRAGKLAGIEVIAVLDEPSAAALANRFEAGFGGKVGVYDFGGGTFDFSIVDVSGGDFRVLATAGDTWLGGDDFDRVLGEAAANQFWRQRKVDLRKQAVEWQRLLFACERAKRELTAAETAAISVPEVLRTADGMVDLQLSVDRQILQRASAAIIQRSLGTCDEALSLLDMKPGELSAVYLSGGTTYLPPVREALSRHFGVPIRTGVPPEYAVCLGTSIHAAQIQLRGQTTLDARQERS